ncbi:type II toxin-antitoxin system VapC family toxin [Granulicella sp. dw_53]|uniref:type II toxin-antitoxin system VapC family toxin n=1 Tax=Granulicella sp. dw_53 TaxID=2719792 RepID=UPI001BD363D1|nr:type II toxin-antitoxin system VapC family toxin [Granulicella sp. dw_53]
MRYLLDTSVISQAIKERPDGPAIRWLHTVGTEETYLSAITLAELRRGVELLPAGSRRRNLENWLQGEVAEEYRGRILPVDEAVADAAGRISVEAERGGHNGIDLPDILIAATARVHGLEVATLNRKDFTRLGVRLVEF